MKTDAISVLLGVTQKDLALLLGVSKSHYSMFELGKRDLPPSAMQAIAAMLAHVQGAEKILKRKPHEMEHEVEQLIEIKRLLKDNEYRQLVLSRKVAAAERKYVAHVRKAKLVTLLADRDFKSVVPYAAPSKILSKITPVLEEKAAKVLVAHRLQLENLQVVQVWLESKLAKLGILDQK